MTDVLTHDNEDTAPMVTNPYGPDFLKAHDRITANVGSTALLGALACFVAGAFAQNAGLASLFGMIGGIVTLAAGVVVTKKGAATLPERDNFEPITRTSARFYAATCAIGALLGSGMGTGLAVGGHFSAPAIINAGQSVVGLALKAFS